MDSWYVGIPVVIISAWVSVLLLPGMSLSLTGVLRFIPFFFWHSLRGGVGVARLVLDPQLPLSPGIVKYCWRLPPGVSRVFMANTVSLLPGSLSVEVGTTCLHLHVLNDTDNDNFSSELATIEQRVADLFTLDLITNTSANTNASERKV